MPARHSFPTRRSVAPGADWLFAHNRGEGHAMVHFTVENRGSVAMSGAQTDSTVYSGVKLAKEVGPLVAVKMLFTSDTLLTVLLRSKDSATWKAQFRAAPQPSFVKVAVRIDRS